MTIDTAVGDCSAYAADEQTLEWQRWRECKKKEKMMMRRRRKKKKKRLFVLNLVVGKVRDRRSKVSNVVHARILNLSIKEKKIASVLLLKGVL